MHVLSSHPPDLSLLFFFFLMIRRPPRSTLFPTRRSSDLSPTPLSVLGAQADTERQRIRQQFETGTSARRSEEHTSELQSPCNLVCRLLLEKKKECECSSYLSDIY